MRTILVLFLMSLVSFTAAQDSGTIQLPQPATEGGRPLMQVLKERKTSRTFSAQPLSRQELSNLLWAAFGINRPETGGRTAPSAMNMQEIDLYVALAEGLFLYDAKANTLRNISKADVRALTGKQPFVKEAPLNIVYVADLSKAKNDDLKAYAAVDAGFIAENVYLYCASFGLATVVRGSVDKVALGKAMGLKANQEVVLAQTVGYPAAPAPTKNPK